MGEGRRLGGDGGLGGAGTWEGQGPGRGRSMERTEGRSLDGEQVQ